MERGDDSINNNQDDSKDDDNNTSLGNDEDAVSKSCNPSNNKNDISTSCASIDANNNKKNIEQDKSQKLTTAQPIVKNKEQIKEQKEKVEIESKQKDDHNNSTSVTTKESPPSSQSAVMVMAATTTATTKTTIITPSKSSSTKPQKIKVHFVAVGSAPLMKKNKFLIAAKEPFSTLQDKLSKMLQIKENKDAITTLSSDNSNSRSNLFLYLHQSFVPSPEDLVGDLSDLFSVRGELILHYSLQEAWG